ADLHPPSRAVERPAAPRRDAVDVHGDAGGGREPVPPRVRRAAAVPRAPAEVVLQPRRLLAGRVRDLRPARRLVRLRAVAHEPLHHGRRRRGERLPDLRRTGGARRARGRAPRARAGADGRLAWWDAARHRPDRRGHAAHGRAGVPDREPRVRLRDRPLGARAARLGYLAGEDRAGGRAGAVPGRIRGTARPRRGRRDPGAGLRPHGAGQGPAGPADPPRLLAAQ
ncbi:MAG: hypothetical protein AVDCRST_MAG79-2349, partial [uncultured Thermoleophilia bacterium]